MDFPLCISERGKNCSGPPRTENGDITTLSEKQYRSGSSVEFRCQTYYAMEGQNRSFCNNGTWTKVPICLDPCMIPRTELESQKIEVKDEIGAPENIFVQHGHSIELTCRTGYVLAANSSQSAFAIHCDGTPTVFPKCKEITCNSPRISNGTFRPQRTIYHDGDLIRIQCDSGFTFDPDNGEKVVECTKNGWSPPPKCIKKCDTSLRINNGHFASTYQDMYIEGNDITFVCDKGYSPANQQSTSTCTKNGWSPAPSCILTTPCTTSEEDMRQHNIRHRWMQKLSIYIEEGNLVEFQCIRGYQPHPSSSSFRVQCMEGKLHYPDCIPI